MNEKEQEKMEDEANLIAYEILMPKITMLFLLSQNKTIEDMADYFHTSETSVVGRLLSLGIKPFELLYSTVKLPPKTKIS